MSERGGRGPAGGTCGRARVRVGAAAAGAEPAPAPGRGHRDSDTGTPGQGRGHRDRDSGTGTGTGTPAPGQLQPGAGGFPDFWGSPGLSSFQQSVAMDRIQRIIGVLQKPEMGARYLGTLLQVEGMLRVWFPHVAPKPAQDPAPSPAAATPPRRRPPAGPPGAPRCRRLPGDVPPSNPTGTSGTSHRGGYPKCQTGTPMSPLAPDV
ncbi:circadian-associated transcriptional repressor isoform 2-T3 [Morphnus guianensis]